MIGAIDAPKASGVTASKVTRAREVFGECLGEFDAGDRRNLSDVDRVRCYVESQGRNGCISDVEM